MTSPKPLGLLLVSMSLAACGSSTAGTSSSSHAAPATTHTAAASAAAPSRGPVSVSIKGYAFQPVTITVAPGTKVTFTNRDQTAHTATSTAKAFDTGTLQPGASKAVVLHKPGTYTYYCQFHAFMRATVVVR